MYIILEVQTNADSTVGTLITSYENQNEAESKYHTVLASAAISTLPKHTAFMLTDDGYVIKSECYKHDIPTPEPEPEPTEEEISSAE